MEGGYLTLAQTYHFIITPGPLLTLKMTKCFLMVTSQMCLLYEVSSFLTLLKFLENRVTVGMFCLVIGPAPWDPLSHWSGLDPVSPGSSVHIKSARQ